MFDAYVSGVLNQMSFLADPITVIDAVRALPHLVRSLPIDDNSISVLAMLAGIIGGWTVTGLHQQAKAKRVKLESRKRQERVRKPD
jgi:hypothetical protein